MKIKHAVFLLTLGTLIILLVGCKGFGAMNNTIPTLQDDKVILNPVNSEYGLNAIDVFEKFSYSCQFKFSNSLILDLYLLS